MSPGISFLSFQFNLKKIKCDSSSVTIGWRKRSRDGVGKQTKGKPKVERLPVIQRGYANFQINQSHNAVS